MSFFRRFFSAVNKCSNVKNNCKKDIQLSKLLSWILRHAATEEGILVSPGGFIEVDEILQHPRFQYYTCEDIKRVVQTNDKQRFKLRVNSSTNALEIRANQGHSIAEVTESCLTPILEPKYKVVVHGTYKRCWPQIQTEGLSRMKRNHIHFAKGVFGDQTVLSGIRKNVQIHIYIKLEAALGDGIKFYESDNGVILTPGNDKGYLLPKYFSKVVDVKTGMFAV